MAFCAECGHPLVEGAKFCSNCGSAVRVPVTEPGVKQPEEPELPEAESEPQEPESELQEPEQSEAEQQAVKPDPEPVEQPEPEQADQPELEPEPVEQPEQQESESPQEPEPELQPEPEPPQQTEQQPEQPEPQRAQGFLQAGPSMGTVTPQRARSVNIVAILCVFVGLAAMGAIFFTLNQRLGETGFSFGADGSTSSPQTEQTVAAPTEPATPDPIDLNTDVDGDAVAKRTSTYGASAPAGNLLNGGYVAGDGEWVYYAIPAQGGDWSTTAIGRMKPDGSDKSVIYRASKSGVYIWHMVAEGGRLFFVEETESGSGGQLVSIETNGSGRRAHTATAPSSSVMLNEGVVYAYVEDGIYAYDVKAAKATHMMGGPGVDDLWRTYGKGDDVRLYYFAKGDNTVFAAAPTGTRMSGSKVVELSGDKALVNVVPAEDALWLLVDNDGDGQGDEVMRAGLGGDKVEHFATASGTAYRINVCEKGVVLVVGDAEGERVELIAKKDAAPTVYYSAPAGTDLRLPAVVGDYLYFGVYDAPQHMYRVPLSSPGKAPEIVA